MTRQPENIAFSPAMLRGVRCVRRWYDSDDTEYLLCGRNRHGPGPDDERMAPCSQMCPWHAVNDESAMREARYPLPWPGKSSPSRSKS